MSSSDEQDNEARLIDKLRHIEALFSGATTAGERIAADEARKRIRARLKQVAKTDPPVEYRFKLVDTWSRQVFLALLRRYEIMPFRYPRQRRTTVMANVSRSFVEDILWPEFEQLSRTLREHLEATTARVVSEALHTDTSEAVEVPAPQLPNKR
jgi:hypothetical protein